MTRRYRPFSHTRPLFDEPTRKRGSALVVFLEPKGC